MPVEIKCEHCETLFSVVPARQKSAKFCSVKCRADWRKEHFVGEANPRWVADQVREKHCEYCGDLFQQGATPLSTFLKQKFCSVECRKVGQVYLSGEQRWNWTGGRKKRSNKHAKWARDVISRDKATCQKCGATDIELHAHHIKPYKDYPELRFDKENGITVCCKCHWDIHSVDIANAVNSGEALTVGAEGNPEPSSERKFIEGVTTRGRAYRRWNGNCDWCGTFISKRWSDAKGKKHLFCSRKCATTHNANTREYCKARHPKQPPRQ